MGEQGKRFAMLTATMIGTAIVVASSSTPASAQSPGAVTRVSVDSFGEEGNGPSGVEYGPSVSADGRFIAFSSDATNLVPGDTNGDTDIFVRDQETGVVQRVSITWNGMEARGHSGCPAISADGRFVAFSSSAWNMYDGGANLGNPRPYIYVHDRQDGSTSRVSVAHDGGDPNAWISCPSISGDGARISFASFADNLVADDTSARSQMNVFVVDRVSKVATRASVAFDGGRLNNDSFGGAISRDGRFVAFHSQATNVFSEEDLPPPVYGNPGRVGLGQLHVFVRDLTTGTTELVSQSVDHPILATNGESKNARLSADGRYVAFASVATNLVFPPPSNAGHSNVYVRDRVSGVTELVSRHDPIVDDCGPDGQSFPCQPASSYSPVLSDDGRFVSFSSGSMTLVAATELHGTQVYLFDRMGGRTRRISVNETGQESDKCADEPDISGDGTVVAFRTAAMNLVPDDSNLESDVYRLDRTCDAAGECMRLAACPERPLACPNAEKSTFRLRKRAPGQTSQDRLFWRWASTAANAANGTPFPSPIEGASYQVCVYTSEVRRLAADLAVPNVPACAEDGPTPCWESAPESHRLIAGRQGITKLTLRSTATTRRVIARGRGALLDLPYLPVDSGSGLVVQLQDPASGQCWSATFDYSEVTRNRAGSGDIDGRLFADME